MSADRGCCGSAGRGAGHSGGELLASSRAGAPVAGGGERTARRREAVTTGDGF